MMEKTILNKQKDDTFRVNADGSFILDVSTAGIRGSCFSWTLRVAVGSTPGGFRVADSIWYAL